MNRSIIEIIKKSDDYESNNKENGLGNTDNYSHLDYNDIGSDEYEMSKNKKMNDLNIRVGQLKDDEDMIIEVTDFNDNIMEYEVKKEEMSKMMKDFNALNVSNKYNQISKHYYMMISWIVIFVVSFIGVILTLSSDGDTGPFIMLIVLTVSLYGGFSIIKHILKKSDK